MKKIWKILALTLVLALAVSTCVTASAEGKIYKIGWSFNNMDATLSEHRDLALAWAEEHKDEAEFVYTDGQGDLNKQLADVEDLLAQNIDILIVSAVDADGMATAVDMAHDAGIKYVAFGNLTNSDEVDLSISTSYDMESKKMSEYLTGLLEADPDLNLKIGHIRGNLGMSTVTQLWDGMEKYFISQWGDTGRIEFVCDDTANWSTAEATALAEDWIQAHPEINCWIAQSDEMAFGAIQAIVAAGYNMDDVIVVSRDGLQAAYQEIVNGNLDCTIAQLRDVSTALLLDSALALARGEEVEITEKQKEDLLVAVDANNVNEFIK